MMKRTLKQVAEMLAVEYGTQGDIQISGVTIDSRKVQKGNLFVPFKGENVDGHYYIEKAIENGASAALWQKDVPEPPTGIPLLIVEDTLLALQTMAAKYLEECGPKVVGITGSNGKTTTKDTTASILSEKYKVHKTEGNYNNHLGLPLTILSMEEDTEIIVLEMGMSSKGEIELLSNLARPEIAIITNIGESHLLDLGSREAIADAKLEITSGLKKDGIIIYHGDEILLSRKLKDGKWKSISFGRAESNDLYPRKIRSENTSTAFTLNIHREELNIPVLGNHNVLNAMAAIAASLQLGVDWKGIQNGLSHLKLTNMRMEMVEGSNGERIINDAYNASPTAMRAAIELVSELTGFKRKFLVLGDMLELGEEERDFHYSIGEFINGEAIDKLYTYGRLGKDIAEGAKGKLGEANVHAYQDKDQLINDLKKEAAEGDLVLVKASRGMKLEEVVYALQKK